VRSVPTAGNVPVPEEYINHIRRILNTSSSVSRRKRFVSISSNGASTNSNRRRPLPDYEIRLFNTDGTLAIVHVSHCHSDEEALSHARRLNGEHSQFEIHRDGLRIEERRR